jgi:chorismate--pyruvate lyase
LKSPEIFTINKPLSLPFEWLSANQLTLNDAYLLNWLLDTGSLTERLQSMCRQFRVQVLYHGRLTASSDYIREVVLWGDNQPWVYAHSVIPEAINNGELTGLGNKPLGQIIFNDSRFERGKFEVCRLSAAQLAAQHNEVPKALFELNDLERSLYGRRSSFTFLSHSMSVAEVFLPDSPVYANRTRGCSG